jgi:dihydrofolate reductase
MRLLMAVSKDGFLAKSPEDDMQWTGSTDKKLFWLLTQFEHGPLLISEKSAAQMPTLPGRQIVKLSSSNRKLLSLEQAAAWFEHGLLLGGPTLARTAISMGLIETTCVIHCPKELGDGMKASDYLKDILHRNHYAVSFGDYEARIYK